MKKNLTYKRKQTSIIKNAGFALIFMIGLLLATESRATTATVSSNDTWEVLVEGAPASYGYADALIITKASDANNWTVSLTKNVNMQGQNLTLQTTGSTGNIVLNLAGYSLTNVGNVTFTTSGGDGQLILNGGRLECASINGLDAATDKIICTNGGRIQSTGDLTIPAVINFSVMGTTTVASSGNLTFAAFDMTDNSTLNIETGTGKSTTFNGAIGTGSQTETININSEAINIGADLTVANVVNYNGSGSPDVTLTSGANVVFSATTIDDLAITTATFILGSHINVTGSLNINGATASTLAMNGYALNIDGTLTNNLGGGVINYTFTDGSSFDYFTDIDFTDITFSFTGTANIISGGDITLPAFTLNHAGDILNLKAGAAKTLTINGDITGANNGVLNLDADNIVISGATISLSSLNYTGAGAPNLELKSSADKISAITVNDLNIAGTGSNVTLTLAGDMVVNGNLKFVSATNTEGIDLNGNNLNVKGNVIVPAGGTDNIIASGANEIITFGGNVNFDDFSYNDPGNDATVIINGTATALEDLTIPGNLRIGSSGRFTYGDAGQSSGAITLTACSGANTTLQVDGELILNGTSGNLTNLVLGRSTANHRNGQLRVNGTMAANEYVNITLNTYATGANFTESINFPSTISKINNLSIIAANAVAETITYTVNLTDDLEIGGNLVLTGEAGTVAPILRTNSNQLKVAGTVGVNAGATLNANSGDVIFEKAVTLTSGTLLFNSATNAVFYGNLIDGGSGVFNIYELNNLIFHGTNDNSANNFTMTNDLVCHGNLEIYMDAVEGDNDGDILVTGGNDITVYGDLIVDNQDPTPGTTDICLNVGVGTDLYLYGNMNDGGSSEAANTYATPENISLHLIEATDGGSSQFTFPTGLTEVSNLTVERTNGLAINSDITINNNLVITRGNIDLNGNNDITLGNANSTITETGGKIVNTGVEGGYIATAAAGSTDEQIISSGIGIEAINDAAGGYIVYRFPKMTVVEGPSFDTRITVGRAYGIKSTAAITDVTFRIDDDELGNNSFAGLDVYYLKHDFTPDKWISMTGANGTGNTNVVLYDDDNPHTAVNLVHTPTSNGYGTLRIENPTGNGCNFETDNGALFAFASQRATSGRIYTFTGTNSQLWNDSGNWDGGVVPTVDDDVVISQEVLVPANANGFGAGSLILTGAGSIKPVAGEEAKITVKGDVNLNSASSYIDCVNGTGRLTFEFGEVGGDPISVSLTPGTDYASGKGIRFHDILLHNANVSLAGNNIVFAGDANLDGVSVLDATKGTVTFDGGAEVTQEMNVSGIATVSFKDIIIQNNAKVTTNASISLTNELSLKESTCSFRQESTSDVYFDISIADAVGASGWNVVEGAICQFDNLNLSTNNGTFVPYGDIYMKGDLSFTATGTGSFSHNSATSNPDGNAVIFSNTSATSEITNTADAADMKFDELRILENCKVNTSSNFYINRSIYVEDKGALHANSGTVYLEKGTNVTKLFLENISNQTLEFFNLNINAQDGLDTYSDFTVKGDLTNVAGSTLNCFDGTVTFENTTEKSISNVGTLNFHQLAVPEGSLLTTASSFSITNNADDADYRDNSGIEVNGTFRQTNGVVTFENLDAAVQSNPGTGYPKTIKVGNNGTLDLYRITIANEPNNDVVTESNFYLGGGGTDKGAAEAAPVINCENANLGGTFIASNGSTITFDGDHPLLSTGTQNYTYASIKNPNTKNALILDNVVASGITLGLMENDYLTITGNLTINGDVTIEDPQFVQELPSAAGGYLLFSGNAQQTIGGTSTHATPVMLSAVEIKKTNTSSTEAQEVLLAVNTQLQDDNAGNHVTLYLTEGYLNLGNSTFTIYEPDTYVQSVTATSQAAINGGTGTLYLADAIHGKGILRDFTFTVNDKPTLYNLYVSKNDQVENDLTINNNLTMAGDLQIQGETLTVNGDITIEGTAVFTGNNTGTLKLEGEGKFNNFSNSAFAGNKVPFNLYLGRGETLAGDLTIGAVNFMIDCGIGTLELVDNTLDMTSISDIVRISGNIKAGPASEVIWSENDYVMPANFFANEECGTLNLSKVDANSKDFVINGDLTINQELIGILDIYTNDNILEFAAACKIGDFTSDKHIIGNLKRTLISGRDCKFPLGDGVAKSFRPLTITSGSSLTSQAITVSTSNEDPTAGRGGNPSDAVDIAWNIKVDGTPAIDNVKLNWQWENQMESGGYNATTGNTFPAYWNATGLKWINHYDKIEVFNLANNTDTRSLSTDGAKIPIDALTGTWAIFATAKPNSSVTDVDTGVGETAASQRDDAVSKTKNVVKIARITNLPVGSGLTPEITVQLQDQYGQPIKATQPFEFTIKEIIGNGGWADYTNVIPAGETSKRVSLTYTADSDRIQLVADTSGGSDNWMPSASEVFSKIGSAPGTQASDIVISNITASSASIDFKANISENTIILIHADELLETDEYPVDGTSYIGNALVGAGSTIGNASVIFDGAVTSSSEPTVKVYGLAPQTTYYVYALNYNQAGKGTEAYTRKSAIGNPKEFTTTGTIDDDLAYGNNDTRVNAKPIGTNSPVRGTIKDANDEDWYCFTVTGATPNVRATLTSLPANYDFEIYDVNNLRLRRGIRANFDDEAALINYMQPGTYLIRIYGVDGAHSETDTYELIIGTNSGKVYSVSK